VPKKTPENIERLFLEEHKHIEGENKIIGNKLNKRKKKEGIVMSIL
jgi:hypothetical protein